MPLYCADAFTDHAFAGNPAAVCILEGPSMSRDPSLLEGPSMSRDPSVLERFTNAEWMQRVAAEMNLSETAFLVPAGEERWELRWFTPTVEVDLRGHATLASAHVLWTEGFAPAEQPLVFETASGRLTAQSEGEGIALDFPAEPAKAEAPPPGLLGALGVDPTWVGRNRLDWLIEVASPDAVQAAAPHFAGLRSTVDRGVIVTAAADGAYDFVSRYFAPAAGIDEDPVTGSAHCALGPYWAERLGRDELVGYQASPRGGVVRVRPVRTRVILTGTAVTVWRGELASAAAP